MSFYKSLIKSAIPLHSRQVARGMYQRWLYKGDTVLCSCCGGTFRTFLPAGGLQQRQNARCPGCGSLERHRLLWLYLQQKTNLFSDSLRMLHVAPEYMMQKKLLSFPNITYMSVDLDSPLAMERMD